MAVAVAKREAALDLDALIRSIVDERNLHDEKDVLPLVDEAITDDMVRAVLRELLLPKISSVMNDQLHKSAREPVGVPLRVVTSEGKRVAKESKVLRVTFLDRGVRVPGEQSRRRLGKCAPRHIKLICEDRETRARVALGDYKRWKKLLEVMVAEKVASVDALGEGVVHEILGASVEMLDVG